MATLTEALRATLVEEREGARVYSGEVDKNWTIVAVPHGGYALGLIVNSCLSAQAETGHPEIAHITGHYFRSVSLGHFEVHIRAVRIGKAYSNVAAELIQKNVVRISAQLIFKAPVATQETFSLTILPPSPYARRVPLHTHPSVGQLTSFFKDSTFNSPIRWAEDQKIRERNKALGRGEGPTVGGGGLRWGAWIELPDPTEKINEATVTWAGDIMKHLPELLPKGQRPPDSWHATMVISVEYKAKIPDDHAFSPRTLGLFSCARFMHEGRHDVYVEVWTAPTAIGEGVEVEGWRDQQVCLGIAHQMAVTILPQGGNERKEAQVNCKL